MLKEQDVRTKNTSIYALHCRCAGVPNKVLGVCKTHVVINQNDLLKGPIMVISSSVFLMWDLTRIHT